MQIRNVVNHEKENRMESFFLAETTKYLYLLFDENNFIHNEGFSGDLHQTPHGQCIINAGPYIFNTEAHPIDMSALYCCHNLKENIFENMNLDEFSEAALLTAERKEIENRANSKYECSESGNAMPIVTNTKSKPSSNAAHHSNLSVDIEVFDDRQKPADDVLVENFERIKSERASSDYAQTIKRNQLTVTDLEEFFSIKKSDFQDNQQILQHIITFMQNYTLDSTYIAGLQLFNKSLAIILGSSVQKEFETGTKSLWELYEMQQQFQINADFILNLGLLAFEEENITMLSNILNALNHSEKNYNLAETADLNEQLNEQTLQFWNKIADFRLKYETALVNTTAMQEFLMTILKNGTSEKKRQYVALLKPEEYAELKAVSNRTNQHLFASAYRIIELKKRMVETFSRLQTLMQESNIAAAGSLNETSFNENLIPKTNQSLKQQQITFQENASFTQSLDKQHDANEEDESSVWSQLVQTILRKTTLQKYNFNEEQLLKKIRKSMQQYNLKTDFNYKIFSCKSPKFMDNFAYRDFYP